MFNSALVRSLIVYAVCMVVAVFVGYQLANWDDSMNLDIMLVFLVAMLLPMLLKWHHFWLIAAWNTTAWVYFLPGKPSLVLVLTGASLMISVLQHAINREALFIQVRTIVWPLVFLTLVILVTARFTGGIGLNIAGSANVGGKHYILMLGAILGYFALAAQRIPTEKAVRNATAFFLTPVTLLISDISLFVGPSAIYYIYLFFPSNGMWEPGSEVAGPVAIERFGGVAFASVAAISAMLAIYGIRGTFNLRYPWRAVVFLICFAASMFGGFRSALVTISLTFALVFVLEGLAGSAALPVMIAGGGLAVALLVPFADQLPLSVQRTLSVVPYIPVSTVAKSSAQASTEWREQMWQNVAPEIPKYLVLGKGYSVTAEDLAKVTTAGGVGDSSTGAELVGDYHNGPLSVIIPFGIAGVVGFVWFIGAGIKVLYYNYKYGDPLLHRINTFFLASFIAKTIFFLFVFGSLYGDLVIFTGLLGVNVAINGGMREPVRLPKRRVRDTWRVTRAQPASVN